MYKKIGFAVVGLAFVASPLLASASTLSDLFAQLESLLSQTRILQQQGAPTSSEPVMCTMEAKQCPDGSYVGRSGPNCEFAPCGGGAPPSLICPQILRSLSQGSTGEDVRSLQAYLGVLQTGYFGPLTASAVAKFQATEGLEQVGMVGPQTRAAFARRCGQSGSNSQNFLASPTSGAAPLFVFFGYPDVTIGKYESFLVDFGDGNTLPIPGCLPGGDGDCRLKSPHTYSAPGVYTAKLFGIGEARVELGAVTITVGGSTNTGAPTITLLSPNGGETWQGVSGQTIRWNSTSVANGTVNIELIDYNYNPQTEDNYTHYRIVNYAANTGSYTINPNSNLGQVKTGNNYKIRIGAYQQTSVGLLDYDNLVKGDLSDAPFTVSGSGTVSPPCCKPTPPPIDTSIFSVSNASGQAPLSVNFSSMTGGGDMQYPPTYTLNFGDGQSVMPTPCYAPADACVSPGLNPHTYWSPGTYTATLTESTRGGCSPAAEAQGCLGSPASIRTLGTVTITVR